MAAFAFRFAAVATAVFLVSCGGGSDVALQQVSAQVAPFVGTPVAGTTIGAGSTRRQALTASSEASRPTFDARFQPTAAANVFVKKAVLAAVAASEAITVDQLFDWAEVEYPQYFPFHQSTRNGDYAGVNYDFRCYNALTDNCVGVAKSGADIGGIYGIGPYTGGSLVRFGHIGDDTFQCAVNPTSCGPKLQSAKLVDMKTGVAADANGATGVAAKGTKLVLTYDQLDCAGVGGTGVVGQLILTISCAENKVTFVPGIPGEERWTFGSDVTVSAAGLRNTAGYPSRLVEVTFSTQQFSSTKVFVGNAGGFIDHRDVSMIDRTTGAITGLALSGPNDGNLFVDGHFAVSRAAGVVYAAPNSADYIYRRDPVTGESLTPLPIYRGAVVGDPVQGVQGVASSDKLVCAVTGRLGLQASYGWRNVMMCWDHFTLIKVFESPVDFVTDSAKIAFDLRYSEKNKKFYSINGTESAVYIEEYLGNHYRDGFRAGTPGTVTEIDCETLPCRVTHTYSAGSVPRGITEDSATGTLYVTNSGDKSMTVITPSTGQAVTHSLLNFTGWQVPIRVLWDAGRLLVGDYMSAVVVMNPTTLTEVGRIETGNVPMGITPVGDEIWVALPWSVATGASNQLGILDRSTLALKRTLTNVGAQPWVIIAP